MIGWDGMEWDVIGWDEMEWGGMEWDRVWMALGVVI